VDPLGYYRQFDDVDEQELNRERRERRAAERRLALEQVPDLDLSGTEWPDLPHSEIVNAAIARARGRVNGYPDRYASAARRLLGERHGVAPEQVVLGNGAAELLQAAALALLSKGDEIVMPWPSYPLYPLMATRAGAKPVSVTSDRGAAHHCADLAGAVTHRTRAIVICNPNDPTGHYLPADELGRLLAVVPERVFILLDEALVHFQDADDLDACLRLVNAFPRLLVVRTFSKAYGLSGLRVGYGVGSDADLLGTIAPVLGVNALSQAAVEYALRAGDAELARRREAVSRERRRLFEALGELPVEAEPSQANFVWMKARGMDGAELSRRLLEQGVIVAPGGPLGADDHVRVTVRDTPATDRLVRALQNLLDEDRD
jgi:histidinol-phosphate aminotransferase